MNRKYYLWDEYFANTIYDWDIWKDWNRELIVDRLHDVEEDDFTDEEIDYLLNEALDYQKEKRYEEKQENMLDLEDEISNVINNSYNTKNLSCDDIGKVLVKTAANYFEE